jgi:hypothetical protein
MSDDLGFMLGSAILTVANSAAVLTVQSTFDDLLRLRALAVILVPDEEGRLPNANPASPFGLVSLSSPGAIEKNLLPQRRSRP